MYVTVLIEAKTHSSVLSDIVGSLGASSSSGLAAESKIGSVNFWF